MHRLHLTKNPASTLTPLHSYCTKSGSITLNVTGADYCSVFCLNNVYLFIAKVCSIWWCALNDSFPKNIPYS